MNFNVQEQAARVHELNAKWWVNLETGEPIKRNFGELIMLTVSELGEALEGDRKSLMDDKLPHRSMFEVELADTLIRILDYVGGLNLPLIGYTDSQIPLSDNTAENLLLLAQHLCKAYDAYEAGARADENEPCASYLDEVIIGIFALGESMKLDVLGAYEEKLAYNAQREDHKVEARKAAGGKKY